MWSRFLLAGLLAVGWLAQPVLAGPGGERMVVHEWGTFTTLQDDDGKEMFGINIDDEPVPDFVHNLEPYILNTPVLSHDYWMSRQKGVPRYHPQASMRLETPVIYFYPPAGAKLPLKLDVNVKFKGGWLTEFFPNAAVRIPGAEQKRFDFSNLTRSTVSELAWRGLEVGTQGKGPKTSENVWLAPRRVGAVNVTNNEDESEKYLFYRGVAQQNSAIKADTSSDGQRLTISANFANLLTSGQQAVIPHIWLMEARADGTTAYRELGSLEVANDQQRLPRTINAPRRFSAADFSRDNRGKLEAEMHQALVSDGLFADEATAMLSTWQRAYFTSSGLRLFYIVPRAWTDAILPLTISGDPEITRVMIGRVELISDKQHELLEKLAKADGVGPQWLDKLDWDSPARQKLLAGRSNFGDLGVKVPEHFQLYLDLGRFRNALLVAEEQKRGSKQTSLTRFIESYQLHPFRLNREPREE
jgi:hypothetical protein